MKISDEIKQLICASSYNRKQNIFVTIMVTFYFNPFAQTNNLGTLGITGFKQVKIDSDCSLIITFAAAEFGTDNPNCKYMGQVISCYGNQQI